VDGLLASFDDYWRQSPYLNPDQDLAADNGLFSFERNSAANFLAQRTSDPRLRTILSYPAILIGVRPEKAPIDTHAQVLNSYLRSAHYIQGGGARLAAAFAWGLKGQGVEVFTSSPAARVDLGADGKVAAVQTADGRSFETRNCVYTGSPIQLPGLLGHRGLRSKQSQRLSGLKESISGFVLHAKFKGQPKDFPACPNWLLIRRKGWLQFDGLEQKDGPDGVHISLSQEPNGPLGLSIIAPCSFRAFGAWSSSVSGRRPAAYYDLKDRLQEKLLGLLDREFPELNGRLQPLETSTPLTFRDYCRNPYGGLYGVRHHIDQYPTLPVNKVKGLVLAGQGVIAPGILGAVISGIVATAMIKGRKQTLNLIRQAQCKES
jgi:all-trans-retinol 13,14-reductase